MIDLTEKMLHIRQIPVGAMLPPPVLRVIAEHLRERTFAAGTRLMRRGEPIDGLHMLTEGGVAPMREGASTPRRPTVASSGTAPARAAGASRRSPASRAGAA